jgi:hypothetical protein
MNSLLRAALAALFVAVALVPLGGGVASAHSGGLEPSPALPRILAVEPAVPGLTVTVIEVGARLRLDNGTAEVVEVVPPAGAARAAEPVVPAGGTGRWADRRILDALASGSPWTVPMTVDGATVTVRGEIVVPPPPATGWWWLATAVVAAGATLLGASAVRRRAARIGAAALTLVAVAAHVVHVLGSALVPDELSYWPTVFGTAGIGLGAWAFGLVGAGLALAGKQYGLLFCALAGAILAMITVFDTASFADAVLPYGWDPAFDRAATTLSVGAGSGLFLMGFAVLRQLTPTELPDPSLEESR